MRDRAEDEEKSILASGNKNGEPHSRFAVGFPHTEKKLLHQHLLNVRHREGSEFEIAFDCVHVHGKIDRAAKAAPLRKVLQHQRNAFQNFIHAQIIQ